MRDEGAISNQKLQLLVPTASGNGHCGAKAGLQHLRTGLCQEWQEFLTLGIACSRHREG